MKNILNEHKELAENLANEIAELRLNSVRGHYEAVRECYEAVASATWKLTEAMMGKYTVNALPGIAELFDLLLSKTGGVCGSINAGFFRDVKDEDGYVIDTWEVDTWEDATFARISTDSCNWSDPRCAKFETFASTLTKRIEYCISEWNYSSSETEHDGAYQDFDYCK